VIQCSGSHENLNPRIGRKALPPDSPDLATAVENLANAYRDAGQFDKALPLYQDFVERQRKLFGGILTNTTSSPCELRYRAHDALPPLQ